MLQLKPTSSSCSMRTPAYKFADPFDQRDKAYCHEEGSIPVGIPELIHQGSPKAKRERSF